jgi:hypothetical protein
LTLTGVAPGTSAAVTITPAAGALSLTGTQVSRLSGFNLTPQPAALTIGGASSTTETVVGIAAGALAFASDPPLVAGLITFVTPLTGDMSVKGAQPVAYINVGFGEGVLSLVGMTPRVLVSAQIRQKKTKLKIRGFSVPTTSTPTPPTGAAVQAPTKLRIR